MSINLLWTISDQISINFSSNYCRALKNYFFIQKENNSSIKTNFYLTFDWPKILSFKWNKLTFAFGVEGCDHNSSYSIISKTDLCLIGLVADSDNLVLMFLPSGTFILSLNLSFRFDSHWYDLDMKFEFKIQNFRFQ